MKLLDVYMQLCFGKKIVADGKVYDYWKINKGKACSLTDFEKFIERLNKKAKGYVQISLFD